MGVGNARKLYKGCGRATLDYGSRVWWGGQKELATKMDKAEEKSMRRIGGHYRTAPGEAIMVENDMTPAAARLEARQRRNVTRLLRQPKNHPLARWVRQEIRIKQEEEEWRGVRRKKKGKRGSMRGVDSVDEEIKGEWKRVEKGRRIEGKERE